MAAGLALWSREEGVNNCGSVDVDVGVTVS